MWYMERGKWKKLQAERGENNIRIAQVSEVTPKNMIEKSRFVGIKEKLACSQVLFMMTNFRSQGLTKHQVQAIIALWL